MRETRKSHPGSNSAGRGTHGGKQGVTTVHHADVQSREVNQKTKAGARNGPKQSEGWGEAREGGRGSGSIGTWQLLLGRNNGREDRREKSARRQRWWGIVPQRKEPVERELVDGQSDPAARGTPIGPKWRREQVVSAP